MHTEHFIAKYPEVINDGVVLEHIKELAEKACKMYYKDKDYKEQLRKIVELINDFL